MIKACDCKKCTKVFKAMNSHQLMINLEEMRSDKSEGSLYHAWQCNIAMAFKDEVGRKKKEMDCEDICNEELHEIANQAAKNFLDLLIKE